MDIEPQTLLAVAAVGALAYTCMNKKKKQVPVLVGGKRKSTKKNSLGRCGRGKRTGFRCSAVSRSNPSVCKRWKKDSKCNKSMRKSKKKSVKKSVKKSAKKSAKKSVKKSAKKSKRKSSKKSRKSKSESVKKSNKIDWNKKCGPVFGKSSRGLVPKSSPKKLPIDLDYECKSRGF